MTYRPFARWTWCAGALAVLAVGLVAVTGRSEQAPPIPRDLNFSAAQPIEIAGYRGDAMEPFVTRDGRWLIFNTRNGPGDQTDLMIARRRDDRHYLFVGPLGGANSPALDGVASVDRAGHFFFVSDRDYDSSGNTLWRGEWIDGRVTRVRPVVTDFTPKQALRLNMDAEVTADGSELYVAENRWNLLHGRPATSRLSVASHSGDRFVRRPNSDELMHAINGSALNYAPATTSDRLTLYFTRWDADEAGAVPRILVARRPTIAAPWSPPRVVAAASGFVEGPSVTPDGCGIVYHARVDEVYRLFLVRRRHC